MDVYHIHNTVRRVGTRLQRHQAAGRHRFVQRLDGGAVTIRRNRYAAVSDKRLAALLLEVKAKVEAGMLEVRTPGGQVVDLSTMKAAAKPVAKPQMAKHEDAGVAEDKPQGPPLIEQGSPPSTEESVGDLPDGHAADLASVDEPVDVAPGGDPVATRKAKRQKASKGKGSKG